MNNHHHHHHHPENDIPTSVAAATNIVTESTNMKIFQEFNIDPTMCQKIVIHLLQSNILSEDTIRSIIRHQILHNTHNTDILLSKSTASIKDINSQATASKSDSSRSITIETATTTIIDHDDTPTTTGSMLVSSLTTTPLAVTGSSNQAMDCDSVTTTANNHTKANANGMSSRNSTNSDTNNNNDSKKIRTRHIALHVYYDGEKYNGLAENYTPPTTGSTNSTRHSTISNNTSPSTIEREVFLALQKTHLLGSASSSTDTTSSLSRAECQYSRCGRTDKGVSACKQIIALQLKSAFPIDTYHHDPSSSSSSSSSSSIPTTALTNDELPNNSHDQITAWVPQRRKSSNNCNNNKKNKTEQQQPMEASTTTTQQYIQKSMTEYAFDKILNNVLPTNIRIIGWCPVSSTFSARFACITRTYRYFFLMPKYRLQDPSTNHSNDIGTTTMSHDDIHDMNGNNKSQQLSQHLPDTVTSKNDVFSVPLLSIDKMKVALQYMIGTHDFRNFCKMDVEKVYNFVRTIYSADIIVSSSTQNADVCYFQIVGQAFLWHQIRCIVHILFLVGRGLEDPSIVLALLNIEQNPGKPSYPLANELPLVLHECQYNHLNIGYGVSNLWNTTCIQLEQEEYHLLAAARIRNCIDTMESMSVRVDELHDFATSKINQRNKKQRSGGRAKALVPIPPVLRPNYRTSTITWQEAQQWLCTHKLVPEANSNKLMDCVYTPLLQRSKGTTYEEKVMTLHQQQHTSNSSPKSNTDAPVPSRRQIKYEQNVIKKRKSKEEDAAFYNYMTQQGGSSF